MGAQLDLLNCSATAARSVTSLHFGTSRDALLSPCGRYRWWLTRTWGDGVAVCAFLMLNPSDADAIHNDPTIRRCIRFAQRWGFSGLAVANLYAWRTSDPADLVREQRAGGDVVGPESDRAILATASRARLTIAAWGAHPLAAKRVPAVLELLRKAGLAMHHLGLNDDGSPKHPLARGKHRVPDDVKPERWTT